MLFAETMSKLSSSWLGTLVTTPLRGMFSED